MQKKPTAHTQTYAHIAINDTVRLLQEGIENKYKIKMMI